MLLSSYATASLYQHHGGGGEESVNFSNIAHLWVSMLEV